MKLFRSAHGIERTQAFLDKLARAAWEPFYKNQDGLSKDEVARPKAFDHSGKRLGLLWEALARSMETFRSLLMSASGHLGAAPQVPAAPHGMDLAAPGSNWQQFEYEQILSIVTSDSVASVADATVKTTAYLTLIRNTSGGHGRYLFRGQSNIDYVLVPRLGRELAKEIEAGTSVAPADIEAVSQYELDELAAFRASWPVANADPLDLGPAPGEDDAAWWVLMQHYADSFGRGTRMLDVTTSLHMALLFACVDWGTGLVDTATDGVVYVFVEGQNAVVDDFLLRPAPLNTKFFDASHDILRMVINPPHNERSKAQSGGFIWWPRWWEPMAGGVAYLRVPAENKKEIARELLSFGVGPKEAVRGREGLKNESALRADLGLPRWEPIAV